MATDTYLRKVIVTVYEGLQTGKMQQTPINTLQFYNRSPSVGINHSNTKYRNKSQ